MRTLFRCSVHRYEAGQLVGGHDPPTETLVATCFSTKWANRTLAVQEATQEPTPEHKSALHEQPATDALADAVAPPNRVVLTFEGDGFLYNMCRILAGTLVEVGAGLRSQESVEALLTGEQGRAMAGPTMPPQGLCMDHVEYHQPHPLA